MSPRYEPYGGYDPMSRMMKSSAVKLLIIINAALYVVGLLTRVSGYSGYFFGILGLIPQAVTDHYFVWQFFTAVFLHDNFLQFAFNMIALFFFGPELEWLWGKFRFVLVYVLIGAIANVFAYILYRHLQIAILGASGAVLGILGAYAALYPNRQLLFIIFPIKAKYLVGFYFILSLLGTTGIEGYQNQNFALQFAGLVLGVLYVKLRWEPLSSFFRNITPRLRLRYLRRKYKHLQVIDDRKEKRWDEYKN